MTKSKANLDDDDELFDWAAKTYASDNLPESGSQINLTQYEVNLGTIDKDPLTGDETLIGLEVRKK